MYQEQLLKASLEPDHRLKQGYRVLLALLPDHQQQRVAEMMGWEKEGCYLPFKNDHRFWLEMISCRSGPAENNYLGKIGVGLLGVDPESQECSGYVLEHMPKEELPPTPLVLTREHHQYQAELKVANQLCQLFWHMLDHRDGEGKLVLPHRGICPCWQFHFGGIDKNDVLPTTIVLPKVTESVERTFAFLFSRIVKFRDDAIEKYLKGEAGKMKSAVRNGLGGFWPSADFPI